jgi:radical SAM superfamily enzyme YgiQ (UPF0313 family)
MKVTLVNPPPTQVVEAHDVPQYPHAGLGYLSAFLKLRGVDCLMIDGKLERLTPDAVAERILSDHSNFVGITAMTNDIINAANLAQIIKSRDPQIVTIVGGVHATALPERTLHEFDDFDFLVHGEGELTLFELLDVVTKGRNLNEVDGISFRNNGNIIATSQRSKVENLDDLPFPDYSNFPRCSEYHVITSRGCPYKCIFCMSPYGREKIRERSPQNVIEELKGLQRFRPKWIKLNDETFGFNRPRAIELLDLIVENGLQGTAKVASLRVDHVDLPLLEKMKEAGFEYIDYGIESGSKEILRRTKKGISLEQSEKAIQMTKTAGITVGANFIIGHPGETKETARKTIDFAAKLNADINAIGLMVPYPGTEVGEMAEKGEGGYRLLSLDWEDYNKQLGNALELESLPRREMERLQLRGYLTILIRNYRFLDLLRFSWQHKRSGIAFLKKVLSVN